MFGLQDRLLASWRADQGADGGLAGSADGAEAAGGHDDEQPASG